jgi:quercetin dioxygenase-like cupin family protein
MKYTVNYDEARKLNLIGRDVNIFIGIDTEVSSDHITMGLTEVPPHTAMDPHVHEDKEEIIYVIEGEGYSVVNDVKEKVEKYTAVLFPERITHQMVNDSDKTMKFVFMFNPVHDFAGAK